MKNLGELLRYNKKWPTEETEPHTANVALSQRDATSGQPSDT
jgi:hypothetical protein